MPRSAVEMHAQCFKRYVNYSYVGFNAFKFLKVALHFTTA